jgi:hypothetical protein
VLNNKVERKIIGHLSKTTIQIKKEKEKEEQKKKEENLGNAEII